MVCAVVRVDVGTKLPQAPAGRQLQLTPAESLVVAENMAVALLASVEGTPTSETVMTGVIVIVAVATAVV